MPKKKAKKPLAKKASRKASRKSAAVARAESARTKVKAKATAKNRSRPAPKKVSREVANPLAAEKARLERNKKVVVAFYEAAINRKDFEAAREYMGDTYTQHNPTAADGPEGLRDWLVEFKKQFPNLRATIKKVIAEGDFVVLHVLGENGPSPNGAAVVDIFRVENGKVVEHWDVIQDIPAEVQNANSMF